MDNVCVIICFLVGVLIFSLIRSHCSCDVTEGYCCETEHVSCKSGSWVPDEKGYLLNNNDYPNSLIHDKYVSSLKDLTGIYDEDDFGNEIQKCSKDNNNAPCKTGNYIFMGLSKQAPKSSIKPYHNIGSKGCSSNNEGLSFTTWYKDTTDPGSGEMTNGVCKSLCDERDSQGTTDDGWNCTAYSFDGTFCNIYGNWSSVAAGINDKKVKFGQRYLQNNNGEFIQYANNFPDTFTKPSKNLAGQSCKTKLIRQPSLDASTYNSTNSQYTQKGCFIKSSGPGPEPPTPPTPPTP